MKTLNITLLFLLSFLCLKSYGQNEQLLYKCDTIIAFTNDIKNNRINMAPTVGGFFNINIRDKFIDLAYGSETDNIYITLKINRKTTLYDDSNSNNFTHIFNCIETNFNDNATIFINNKNNKITIFLMVGDRLYLGGLKNHQKYICGILSWNESFRGLSSQILIRPSEQNKIFTQLKISDFNFLNKQY